jgi:hypothetical protein
MDMSGQLHTPAALPRKSGPGSHWIGSWVGTKNVLVVVVKRKIPCFCQELNPGRLGRILVTILTELSWLQLYTVGIFINCILDIILLCYSLLSNGYQGLFPWGKAAGT